MQIQTLADDEKITEPGIYRMSLDRHHSQPCDGVSVTSGVLRQMELASPADVWAFHKLNPKPWVRPETDALLMGRAMAAIVEGGTEEFGKHFAVLPAEKPRRPTEAQIAAYDAGAITDANRKSVEFWRKVDTDPRDYVSTAQWEMMVNMGGVLASDPVAYDMMQGIPEVTMAWRDDLTGLWCLARPDVVNLDGSTADYKKVNTQGRAFTAHGCDRKIEAYGYQMQMGFAAEGMQQVGIGWPQQAGLVFQVDKPPHSVIVRSLSEDALRWGQILNRRALDAFSTCLQNDHWPGPGEEIGEYTPSSYATERLLECLEDAGVEPTGDYGNDGEIKL